MTWEVEYTDEFGGWWAALDESQQDRIAATVKLLAAQGSALPFPHSSGINGSRHAHMRELRVQSGGNPLRVFYAFDPRRRPSCLSVATRWVMIGFTKSMCRWRTTSMTSTSRNSGRRV